MLAQQQKQATIALSGNSSDIVAWESMLQNAWSRTILDPLPFHRNVFRSVSVKSWLALTLTLASLLSSMRTMKFTCLKYFSTFSGPFLSLSRYRRLLCPQRQWSLRAMLHGRLFSWTRTLFSLPHSISVQQMLAATTCKPRRSVMW